MGPETEPVPENCTNALVAALCGENGRLVLTFVMVRREMPELIRAPSNCNTLPSNSNTTCPALIGVEPVNKTGMDTVEPEMPTAGGIERLVD